MTKYVVIVKNGMYLGGLKTHDVFLKIEADYYDLQTKALTIPLDMYIEVEEAREQVDELAKFAEGEVMIIEISDIATALDGEEIDLEEIQKMKNDEEEYEDYDWDLEFDEDEDNQEDEDEEEEKEDDGFEDFAKWFVQALLKNN